MPDNAYGNHPPVEIERDLQQGGDKNWDQKLTNEEDLGDLYSVKFFNHILASTAPTFNIAKQYKDVTKLSADKQHQWRTAMQEEMDSLQDKKVWDLVDLPPGHMPVKERWGDVVKSDGGHKACFVAKGFTQIYGINFKETFSPVARFKSVQLLLSIAALKDWEIKALNVKTAFLFGDLDEEIYLEQPEGFIKKGMENKVCCLRKAIYGLKQAALQWNKAPHQSLLEMGFVCTLSDPGIYVHFHGQDIIILVIYIDDSLFIGSNKSYLKFKKKKFMNRWESRNLGEATEYLGMWIT